MKSFHKPMRSAACSARRPARTLAPAMQGTAPRYYTSSAAAAADTNTTTTTSSSDTWNATRYLQFASERTRPARDLLAQVPLAAPARVVDLGCGPGNSTALLAARYPAAASVVGVDSSANMLAKARHAGLPGNVDFSLGDLRTWTPRDESRARGGEKEEDGGNVDLLFSNAALQWLPDAECVPTMQRLVRDALRRPGGVFAFQVPDNVREPSHVSMAEVAALPGAPWKKVLEERRPARAPFAEPRVLYDALKPLCSSVDIWHTHYQHRLESHEAIVEWFKGSGLMPFLEPLDEAQRKEFLGEYLKRIQKAYPTLADGGVLLKFPRLFVVAVRA